jgi:ankyrin repeat protein
VESSFVCLSTPIFIQFSFLEPTSLKRSKKKKSSIYHLFLLFLSLFMTRDEEDSISDISHRKKSVFSWSSISSTYSQITLLSSHTEDIDTMWTYLMLQGYFLLDTDQKRREKLFELLCRLASQGNLIFIQQLAMDERTSRLVQLDSVDNENQWTPLMYACCFGRLTVARYLLDMGAKVDAQDHSKRVRTYI